MKNMLAVASAAIFLVTAPGWAQQAPPSGSNGLSTQDQQFLQEISQSTLGEVELGNLRAQKGATPTVRLFGRWMASTDALANRQLAAMTERMHGAAPPTTVTAEQQAELRRMQGLSGAEFDRQYLQMMVPGHRKEIAIFEKEAQGGQQPLVKGFAREMVPTAQEHLAAVQDLMAAPSSI